MSASFGPLFPPAADLRVLRGVLAATRRDSLQIIRRTDVADASGGTTTTWATLPDAHPCRVADKGGADTERPDGTRLSALSDWLLGLDVATDVRPSDRLRVTTADGAVHTLEVRAVRVPRTIHLERLVEAVEVF